MPADQRLYITTEKTLQTIPIQFVPPSIKIGRNANQNAIAIVGRNNPLYHYSGGETTLQFQLDFYSESEFRDDVIRFCRLLEAVAANNDGYSNPPERIRLTFGKLFKGDMWWTVKSCPYELSQFEKSVGYLPVQAYMDLSLVLDPTKNTRRVDIL